jgi:aspartate aminotransferase
MSLQESAIRKLDLTVAQQKDVRFHRLNIGQPDVATPEPILEAIRSFQPKVIAYGPAGGLPACREAAADYHSRWSPGLRWQDVAVTTGGSEALLFAFTALCDPGDEILVPEPYYTNYNGFATVAGASIKPIRTELANGFALPDDEKLDTFVTPQTKAILFSNPGNPTGAVYSGAELRRIVDWAKRRDIYVIADEVYRRIWFDEQPTSALEFEDAADHVIIIDSLSKTYSSCGLRLGFLISKNAMLMEKIERLGQARLGAQPLAQHAGIAALRMEEAYYAEIRGVYRRRVEAMIDAVASIEGVSAPKPQGAFYAMLELPVDDADRFARFLVTDFRSEGESLVVAPGPGFYADPTNGRKEIRLAAVIHEDHIQRAIGILGEALDVYPGRV